MDTKRRSFAKAVSWRVIATLITAAIVYAFTGEAKFAATVGVSDSALKFLLYFLHERTWNSVAYGRRPPEPEYHI
jgi:uncharacterized membrane protein